MVCFLKVTYNNPETEEVRAVFVSVLHELEFDEPGVLHTQSTANGSVKKANDTRYRNACVKKPS